MEIGVLEKCTSDLSSLIDSIGAERLSNAFAEALTSPKQYVSASELNNLSLARFFIRSRRGRSEILTGADLGEPDWDMLLDLYVADATGARISISSLCIASYVPSTTALRRINLLVERGFICRVPDEADGRRIFVSLTAEGKNRMDSYWNEVRRQMAF